MKAIVYKTYGTCREALVMSEINLPQPGESQVLVKVKAASINALDYRRFEKLSGLGKFFETRIFRNAGIVPGADISGIVHSVGKKVTIFKPGDEVFGFTGTTQGGLAEFACAEENTLTLKPANISFEAAAATPVAGCVALQAINKCKPILPGTKVLINGASGGVGSFAIQLAKSHGTHVTAVCSAKNIEKARYVGADEIIDYTKTDFTEQSKKYEVIIAVNGFHPILNYWRCLSQGGKYVAIGGEMKQIFQAMLWGTIISLFSYKKMMFLGISKANKGDLDTLANLLESGIIVPLVDRSFPFSQTVDAFEYILDKHTQGKVVLTI